MAGSKPPQNAEEQLAWKAKTDNDLGFVQLDLMEIPAKVILLASSVGEVRVAQCNRLATRLDETAKKLEAGRDPLKSSDPFNVLAGIVELGFTEDDLTARVVINAADTVSQQASAMTHTADSLRKHARALEREAAERGQPPAAVDGMTVR